MLENNNAAYISQITVSCFLKPVILALRKEYYIYKQMRSQMNK